MTTTILRPNDAVLVSSGVTASSTTVDGDTSDESDSTYAELPPEAGKLMLLGLDTFTLSAGSVVKSGRLRVRSRVSAAGSTVVDVSLLDTVGSSTLLAYRGGSDSTSFSTSSVTGVLPNLSQSAVDNLEVLCVAVDQPSSPDLRISNIQLDLTTVAQPVVAVDAVSPDPYTASNIVPVSWVNTLDSDGGGQSRYRLKVFTDAQYGAGGFDPETSTPYFDSGEVLSAATAASTGVLVTGDTYRAYVKVSQTVNGVAHWSAWDYDQFAVAVTTAEVDTVVAVGSNSTASITVTVERDTGSAAWEFVEVERSLDNGVSWSDVRGATYVDATGDADTFQITDYETANEQATVYRARATRIVSGETITSEWVESTVPASWSSTKCWLKAPLRPDLNTTIRLKSIPQLERQRTAGRFNVIGRATPVVVSDVLSTVSGSLDILVELADPPPEELLEQSSLLLHAPEDWNLPTIYFVPGDVRQVRGARIHEPQARWIVAVTETAQPPDHAASAP